MRTIVFIGNCQCRAIINSYRQMVSPVLQDRLTFFHIDDDPTAAVKQQIGTADIVVEQVFDRPQKLKTAGMDLTGRLVRFPNISGRFLFPFSETQHPQNAPIPYRTQGPHTDTDSVINAFMKEGLDADTAIQRYLELDVEKFGRLQALYSLNSKLQRQRDAVCGTDFASLIEARFREEDCFSSAYHIKAPLMKPLFAYLLQQLEVPAPLAAAAVQSMSRTIFDLCEVPIHPAVAKYFGLRFFNPAARHTRFTGERLSFHEFWRSYIHYSWNEELLAGISRAGEPQHTAKDIQEIIAQLRAGLAACRGSPEGALALSKMLQKAGDLPGAIAAAREAVELEPNHAPFFINLGKLLFQTGQLAEAELLMQHGVARWPANPEAYRILRDISVIKKDWAVAAAAAALVVTYDVTRPLDAALVSVYKARALAASGNRQEAKAAALHAASPPYLKDSAARLVWDFLMEERHFHEALAFLHRFMADGGKLDSHYVLLARTYAAMADREIAIAAYKNAVAAAPHSHRIVREAGQFMAAHEAADSAQTLAETHVNRFPASAEAWFSAGFIFEAAANLAAARNAFTEALALDPTHTAARTALAKLPTPIKIVA